MKPTGPLPSPHASFLKSKIIFIVGPTGVGKSAVALELASLLKGEIVSCDAMQVYREALIASDRPSLEMVQRIAHHVLGDVSVEEDFSAARYRERATSAIEDILRRQKTPVVCGGSGMYMMALLDGLFERGEADPEVRLRLEAEAADKGLGVLYERLCAVDPQAAQKIKSGDRQRVIRALEIFESFGQPISSLQAERSGLWGHYDIQIFCLSREREELYRRAEARIEDMFQRGLVEEIRGLLEKRLTPSSGRIIGVPEVGGYLAGDYDLARAKYLMKLHTRHYIKRQLTWFRKDKRLTWVEILSGEKPEDTAHGIQEMMQ